MTQQLSWMKPGYLLRLKISPLMSNEYEDALTVHLDGPSTIPLRNPAANFGRGRGTHRRIQQ